MLESTQPQPFTLVQEPGLVAGSGGEETQKPRAPRSRPSRSLPTERIAFPRQLEVLRAFAIASGPQSSAVALSEVASLVGISANTLSLGTSFWAEAGLLSRTETGKFVPAKATLDFARAHEWNKDKAAHRLAPALQDTWFAQALQKYLSARGSLHERHAVEILAEQAGASREYEPQIRLLIEYLAAVELIGRDGQLLRPNREEEADMQTKPPTADSDLPTRRLSTPAPSAPQTGSGGVAFDIKIRFDFADLADWSADRISALFTGIAMVIAAQNGENSSTGS